jgi:uncharacterized membrane protein YphA (DoxX/SURF4 family)
MSSSFGSSRNGSAPVSAFRTVSLLRIGTGLVLLFSYGMEAAMRGWQFTVKQVPWTFVATLERAAVPMPKVLAIVVAIGIIAVGLSWTLGFLTRLFAACFLPILIGGMIVGERLSIPGHIEVGMLYLLITVSLLISGSGMVSLDTLFKLGSGPKKRR